MPRKIGAIGIALIIGLSFFISCTAGPETAPPSSGSITDQAGRAVTLKVVPQRIVSLAPSNTEILFALGLGDRVVGVTSYDDYPPEAKLKPSIGGFSTPNIEEVVAKNPDLVLAANIHEAKIVPQLEARGLTVLVLDPKNIDDILAAITLVGKVTGKENEAKTLTSDMQKRIKAVTDKTNSLTATQKPSVFYITWNDPLMTVGSGNLDDDIISKAGGINIAQNLKGSAAITLENVIAANPQVIIAGTGMGTGGNTTLQFAMTDARLAVVAARQHNRVYSIDMNVAGRAGPRIADVLEQFARCIHPEIFGPIDNPKG